MSAIRGDRSWAGRFIRAVLHVFPFDFRLDHGQALEQTLRAQHREATAHGGIRALLRLWMEVLGDVVTTAPGEHLAVLKQDVVTPSARCAARRCSPRRPS